MTIEYSFMLQATTTVSGTSADYGYCAIPPDGVIGPLTQAMQRGESWAAAALQTIQERCNSFTYAAKGFSSSIGYLVFDSTAENFLLALQNRRDPCTLYMRQYDGIISAEGVSDSGIAIPKLYVADLQRIVCGGVALSIVKLVDVRYWAPVLAPMRTITVATVPSGITAYTREAFYSGTYGGDWNSTGQSDTYEVSVRQQLAYYWPAFRDNWTPNFGALSSPFTGSSIQVYPDAESPWDICKRALYDVSSAGSYADLYVDSSGNPQIGVITPRPTDFFPSQESEDSFVAQTRRANLLTGPTTVTSYEVLFQLPGGQVYDLVSVPADFAVVQISPYLNPARNPYSTYVAYYPLGAPSAGQEVIQVHSDSTAVPKRKSGTTDGPQAADNQAQFDDWDFDWAALRTLGDADYLKCIDQTAMLSRTNYRRRIGFDTGVLPVLHTDYGYQNEISVLRWADTGSGPYTEYFYTVRPVISEGDGLPIVHPWQGNSPEYFAKLTKRETFVEELDRNTSSWGSSDETNLKIYGKADAYGVLQSSITCQATYGVGEAHLTYRRMDGFDESGTRGVPENHVPTFTRDLLVSETFYGIRRGDGLYHAINQPNLRVGSVKFKEGGDGTVTEYTTDPNIQVRVQAPTDTEVTDATATLTHPTPVIVFDDNVFSVIEKQARSNDMDSDIGSTLLPQRPYAAFVGLKAGGGPVPAILNATLSAQSSASASFMTLGGTPNPLTPGTAFTVWDWMMNTGDVIASGSRIWVQKWKGYWFVVVPYCSTDSASPAPPVVVVPPPDPNIYYPQLTRRSANYIQFVAVGSSTFSTSMDNAGETFP
jgi:hypothetical protein